MGAATSLYQEKSVQFVRFGRRDLCGAKGGGMLKNSPAQGLWINVRF